MSTYTFQDIAYDTSRSPTPIPVSSTQAAVSASWINNTVGSQIGQVEVVAYDSTGPEIGLTVTSSGSAPQIGFFGATPVSQQTGGAATAGTTYTTNEQTMINAMYAALRNLGLLN